MKNTARLLALASVFASSVAFAAEPATPTEPAPPPAATPEAKPGATVIPYPLTVCIVTDNDLGSMGDETRLVHEGREIKFCCAPCEAKFLKNPVRFLKKLEPTQTATSKPEPASAYTPPPAP